MYDFSKRTETALGVKDVGGVKAIGTLIETVYPAGTRGSEKEMVETRETWRSDELAATVYMRTVSPRYGERIVRYENLKFADLPESAFALPSGYPIRNIVLDTRQAAE